MRPLVLASSLALVLHGLVLPPQAVGQSATIRLEGDGLLPPEADRHRGTSPAYGYEETPHPVVPMMIELAAVTSGDVVYEPGCGDARILIAAVQAGARKGLGVDIDPDLAEIAYARVKAAGLEDRIEIRWGNALDVDMTEATVVFLFMGEGFNRVIRPMLWRQLAVGARVVSNDFSMGDWQPNKSVRVDISDRSYVLHLWTITRELKERADTQ